jgi:hypothetical protein
MFWYRLAARELPSHDECRIELDAWPILRLMNWLTVDLQIGWSYEIRRDTLCIPLSRQQNFLMICIGKWSANLVGYMRRLGCFEDESIIPRPCILFIIRSVR